MDIYLKYHTKTLPFINCTHSYWYLGMIFNATDQLYNLDLENEFNDFNKNIKIGNTIKTFMFLFKTEKQMFKINNNKLLELYDNCLMRVGNLYTSSNLVDFTNAFTGISSEDNSKKLPIRYSLMFESFLQDPTISIMKDVPLEKLNLEKYKYDFTSWMIHRSIQELN